MTENILEMSKKYCVVTTQQAWRRLKSSVCWKRHFYHIKVEQFEELNVMYWFPVLHNVNSLLLSVEKTRTYSRDMLLFPCYTVSVSYHILLRSLLDFWSATILICFLLYAEVPVEAGAEAGVIQYQYHHENHRPLAVCLPLEQVSGWCGGPCPSLCPVTFRH